MEPTCKVTTALRKIADESTFRALEPHEIAPRMREIAAAALKALPEHKPVAQVSMTHMDDRDWFEINRLQPVERFHHGQMLYTTPQVVQTEMKPNADVTGLAPRDDDK